MNQEQDYASDSDQSDEDFCPEKEVAGDDSDAASEDDSVEEEDASDAEQAMDQGAVKMETKGKRRGRKPTQKKTKKSEQMSSAEEVGPDQCRRSTRQTDGVDGSGKGTIEKDELESDEEDKSRTDALWADFLSDVTPTASAAKKTTKTTPARSTNGETPAKASPAQSAPEKPQQVTVTEVVDFAGEEVRVHKVVSADNIKENTMETNSKSKASTSASPRIPAAAVKRPGGGLGSIMNQIGKKKKISVLEKTKLDWNSFKEDEGIDEEIQTFNKGKDGYLERQDFLQRTDLRQFEIERNLRQSKRNH